MSTALYRLYRPQKFSEVEGQSSAVGVLIKSISIGRTAHAYLFSGARGCGKTTVARLMAKALNCVSPTDGYEPCCECSNCVSIANGDNLDVIEIDGASNNGVEEIRELKSHVSLAPFNSKYKIYIIDEVHMLSTAAFNALLKTLEEPPEYVVFILATTEPHKIPVTIRSRCQHIPFHRIRSSDILRRLEFVCKKENLEYENEALWEIARQADGALRDALSLLDQVMSFGKGRILIDDVSVLIGGGSLISLQRWLSEWRRGGKESFIRLDNMFQNGASPQRTIEELFYISRNLWIAGVFGHECLKCADISKEEYDYTVEECTSWSSDSLERLMRFLAKLLPQARFGMRTDVIVGILMSRRQEIINGGSGIDDARPKSERKLTFEDGLSNEDSASKIETKEIISGGKASEKTNARSAAAEIKPVVSPGDSNINALLVDRENFIPLDDEVRQKFLVNLKSNEFALYCALLDAEFIYSGEQNKLCVIVRHDYLFHILSVERNYLIFIKIIRAEFPEYRLIIAFKGKSYEYGAVNSSIVNPTKDDRKPEPEEKAPPPPIIQEPDIRRSDSLVYDAAYNAMKFMRGEIVMRSKKKENIDEFDA